MLLLGAVLLVAIGIVHSYLGEKYILIRLFKRDNLPQLLGSDWFTKRVIRFAWHLTTIAWWGFAAILYFLSTPSENIETEIIASIAVVFILSGIVSLFLEESTYRGYSFGVLPVRVYIVLSNLI